MPQMKAIHEIHKGSRVIKPGSNFTATEIESAELLKYGAAELLGEDPETPAAEPLGEDPETPGESPAGKQTGKAAGKAAGKAGSDQTPESEDSLIG